MQVVKVLQRGVPHKALEDERAIRSPQALRRCRKLSAALVGMATIFLKMQLVYSNEMRETVFPLYRLAL